MDADDLRGRLDPMILAVLERAPAHGYAVIEAVRARTGGEVALTTGSVYPALRRLEVAGYVTGHWSTEGGRRRRTYQLTATGRRQLVTERSRWLVFTELVGRVLERPAT